ncbi:phage tail tube protein [Streptomyces avermitilis]|uniref:phage tail tube protein n=1 Tax=Streptomyces avermitilis TaxID=33903 RepID=UPI0038206E6A
MSGNIDNPRLWEGADLYTGPVGTALPTDLTVAMTTVPAWKAVGLLSEDGASESRDEDVNEFYAWGGRLVRTRRSKHKRQIKVTCLEDNLIVFGLINPNSTVTTTTGVNHRVVKVPKSEKASFVLELTDGDITRRRHIPTGEVVEVGEVSLSDSDIAAFELTITIYPDSADVLYHDYDNDPQGTAA